MSVEEYIFKVIVKHWNTFVNVARVRTYYFKHDGSLNFEADLISHFEKGCGRFGINFTIESIEQLGQLSEIKKD